MLKLWTSKRVHKDAASILKWSTKYFGEEAAVRYGILIQHGIDELRDDPSRHGTKRSNFLNGKYSLYHLSNCNDRAITPTGIVESPRHYIVYRFNANELRVYRILHDSRDLKRHLR